MQLSNRNLWFRNGLLLPTKDEGGALVVRVVIMSSTWRITCPLTLTDSGGLFFVVRPVATIRSLSADKSFALGCRFT